MNDSKSSVSPARKPWAERTEEEKRQYWKSLLEKSQRKIALIQSGKTDFSMTEKLSWYQDKCKDPDLTPDQKEAFRKRIAVLQNSLSRDGAKERDIAYGKMSQSQKLAYWKEREAKANSHLSFSSKAKAPARKPAPNAASSASNGNGGSQDSGDGLDDLPF